MMKAAKPLLSSASVIALLVWATPALAGAGVQGDPGLQGLTTTTTVGSATGQNGGSVTPSTDGFAGAVGGFGFGFDAANITITANGTITAGNGQNGPADIDNSGGNAGGQGGIAIHFSGLNGTAFTPGNYTALITNGSVIGGNGGNGGNVGSGSAGGLTGGAGGVGGTGILQNGQWSDATANGTVTGGNGGNGGNGGGAGDAGGNGGNGATGIDVSVDNTRTYITGTVTGGNGGNGGVAVGAAASGNGGGGGFAMTLYGSNLITTINGNLIGGNGGNGGAASGNAASTAGNGGQGGAALIVNSTNSSITINSTATLVNGAGGAAGATNGGIAGNSAFPTSSIVFINVNNTVTNHGTITSDDSGSGLASVIVISPSGNTLINDGHIGKTNIANSAGGVYLLDAINTGIATLDLLNNTNGHIDVTDGNGVFLIALNNGSALTTLTNTAGHITATAGNGVYTQGTITTFNNGSGFVTATSGDAIKVDSGGIISTLTNSTGTISSGTGNALTIDGGKITSLTNTGTISGGDHAIYMNNLTGNTTLNLNGGHVIGDVFDSTYGTGRSIVSIGGNFATEGDFHVSDLTVSSGHKLTISPTNTVTLHSMSASAGTFDFAIDTAASGHHGELVIAAGAADLTGATITANVVTGATLTGGDQIRIVSGTGAITGATEGVVQDNSAVWNFSAVLGNNLTTGATTDHELYLVAQAVTTSNNTNDVKTQAVLQSLGGGVSAPLQDVLNNLNAASTSAEANNILQSVQPDVSGATSQTALDAGVAAQSVVDTRIASLRTGDGVSGMAAGNAFSDGSVWFQGYGQSAAQGTHDSVKGYDANTFGGALGFESTQIFEDGVAGLMLNYGNTRADGKNANTTTTNINSYGITFYGSYDLGQRDFINVQGSYAYNAITTDRHNVGGLGLTARGDTHSDLYAAKAVLGHDYRGPRHMIITPTASAAYSYLNTQGYQETGPGANLYVGDSNDSAFNLGAAVNVSWDLKTPQGEKIKPAIHAGYTYDAIGQKTEVTSSFVGDPSGTTFQTSGGSPARSTFNTGADITYTAAANWSLSAAYDLQAKENYLAHSGMLRLTTRF